MRKIKLLIMLLLAYSGMKAQNFPAAEYPFLFAQNLATNEKTSWSSNLNNYQFATQEMNLSSVISGVVPIALPPICEMQNIWLGSGSINVNTTLLIYDVNANGGIAPSVVPSNSTISLPYNGWTLIGHNPSFHTVMQFQPGDYYVCLYNAHQVNYLEVLSDVYYLKLTVLPALDVIIPPFCPGDDVEVELTGCGEYFSRIFRQGGTSSSGNISWSNGIFGTNKSTYHWPFGISQWVDATYLIEKFANTNLNTFYTKRKYFTLEPINVPHPFIIGSNTTCDDYTHFTIQNYNPALTYNISVSHGTAGAINAQGQFVITWVNFPNPGVATITVTANQNGMCAKTGSFEVASCCEGTQSGDLSAPIVFVNATATQMLQVTNFNGINNRQIVLNGNIIIDQNLTITGCPLIKMAPNAEIIVMSGKTLTINGSTLSGDECGHMWKGTRAFDAASTISVNNSTIEDAHNAIYSYNGAHVQAVASTFRNNNVALRFVEIEPYEIPIPQNPPVCTAIIYGNLITGTGVMLKPLSNPNPSVFVRPAYGIFADNIYQLAVGQVNQAQNIIETAQIGIEGRNSSLVVKNNHLRNFGLVGINYKNVAVASGNGGLLKRVYSKLVAENNTFTGTMNQAIYGFGIIQAQNNTFEIRGVVNSAVWVREVETESFVKNNTFSPKNAQNANINQSAVAVKLERPLNHLDGMNLHVENNTINRYRSGVEVTNTYGQLGRNATRNIEIKNNTINNPGVYNPIYGIRLQNANRANVANNLLINDVNATSSARAGRERGIAISQTQDAMVLDNQVKYYGNGIWSAGMLIGTQYRCNILEGNYNGFYFLPPSSTANTVVSNQGFPGFTTQNRWLDPSATVGAFSRLAGSIDASTNTQWHYNTTPVLYDAQIMPNSNSNFIGVYYNHVPTNSCTNMVWWSAGTIFSGYREEALGDIVQNEQQYEELLQEFSQYGFEYLYEMLTAEPEIMDSEDPSEDEAYYNWMQDMSESNIAKFYSVLQAVDEGNLMQAASVNNSIVPENDLEMNRKTVNSYYLSHYVRGIAFGFEDSVALAQIALLTPYQGGTAVFGARVMLGIDADDHGLSYKQDFENNTQSLGVKLYPNPTKDFAFLQIDTEISAHAQISLFDLLGREIMTLPVHNRDIVEIPLSQLSSGLYIVKMTDSGKEIFIQKLIVQ